MSSTLKSDLPSIASGLEAALDRLARETLFDIERDWKADVRVDTGTYRNSIHTEIEGPGKGTVSSNVEHAAPNEYGTRHMAARPSATRAAERARGEFEAKAAKLEGSLK